ncbi:hypothetical protein [Paenibacillus assamensis]|uniref:hypothetical protein n=1 Tax=Paenibacillus assamensis TaxID=311244 RepID=UPI00048E43F0|nr:hypothetical protein [Paenibacillus assamensis]
MKINNLKTRLTNEVCITNKNLFVDFIIDDRWSLYKLVERHGFITSIGSGKEEYRLEKTNELLLKKLSELGGNRYPIFICPDCGDLGCGYISVIIEKQGGTIIWRDFMLGESVKLTHIGPFCFDVGNYIKEIKKTSTYFEG